LISTFIIRCDGKNCIRRRTLHTKVVGGRNLNAATMYLVHTLKWSVSFDDKGALHYCRRCTKKRKAKLAKRAAADALLRNAFLAKVQKRSEKKQEAQRLERKARRLKEKKKKRRHT
jgi:hypothetical protein